MQPRSDCQMFAAACTGGDASGCRNRDVVDKCRSGDAQACSAFDHVNAVR